MRSIAPLLAVATTIAAATATAITLSVSKAAACPDVDVVFARGTTEPPGVGGVGAAFVDSLRQQVGGRSLNVYAVNYPATNDFGPSIAAGASDASAHVESTAASCPNTKIVLGGYSQGAAVVDVITGDMPADVADNVAAVAVFGNPSPAGSLSRRLWSGSLPAIGPLYTGKTIDLCMPGDPICTEGVSMGPHVEYVQSGMTSQAATFAAGRL